ncbi:hypothetical protein CUMW_008170 [Citrus unshiu]|nr:hypothetical protein CUMW_008170 [Citrus unshiu]
MQSQLVCSGCRSVLLYPRGATNVCCALCNTITSVPIPGHLWTTLTYGGKAKSLGGGLSRVYHQSLYNASAGMEMAQLICGGCRTLLMYTRGATSVRCSCCHTVNLAPALWPSRGGPRIVPRGGPHTTSRAPNQFAHVICGHCRTTLMYPHGAPSVKCAVCQYVTNVNMANARVPLPANRPNGTAIPGTLPSTSMTQTVVVENPMSVDESGKLVSNVVVGVSTEKK